MLCIIPGLGDLSSHHMFLHHALMMHSNSSLTIHDRNLGRVG